MTSLPAPPGYGGHQVHGPSKGYVHEPFAGAWQMNKECWGPSGIFSAVYACIAIISGDLATLPPRIRQSSTDGSKRDLDDHAAAKVLNTPNTYQTRVDFWGQFMSSALFTGNTYVYLARNEHNAVESMHILDPRRVQVMLADDGSVFYRIGQEKLAQLLGS